MATALPAVGRVLGAMNFITVARGFYRWGGEKTSALAAYEKAEESQAAAQGNLEIVARMREEMKKAAGGR